MLSFWWNNTNNLDFDNILIAEKSYKNTLIYDVAYKLPMVQIIYVLLLKN